MNLAVTLLHRLDEPKLGRAEKAQLRCELAKALEDAGSYEAASCSLGDLWQGVGQRPRLLDLDEQLQAELLLRVGALSGWLGSTQQIAGAQDAAKDLIGESLNALRGISCAGQGRRSTG